jgi:hypothetical protein
MGVVLPASTHRVVLVHHTPGLGAGIALGLAGAAALAALATRTRRALPV